MRRSILHAICFASLLAVVAAMGLPQYAQAHGTAHGHGTPSAAAEIASSADDDEAARSADVSAQAARTRSLVHATAPAPCPAGPAGTCGCWHAACLNHIPVPALAASEAFSLRPRVPDTWIPARTPAFRSAFFLLSAPPRAPPVSIE